MMNSLLSLLACAGLALGQSTGKLGNAAITENNPSGASYMASLPSGNGIQGQIVGVSNSNGTGVNFNVNFYQFPDASLGPFLYHIHVDPVPPNGSCAATLAHLDPYQRGEAPNCDATQPATCQVGDLSGKHGTMAPEAGSSFQSAYLDLYLSSEPGVNSFFGNRSIVIHSSSMTRLTCANFELAAGSPNPSSTSSGGGSSASSTPAAGASSTATAASSATGSSTGSGAATSTSVSASHSASAGAVVKLANGAAVLAGVAGVMAFAF